MSSEEAFCKKFKLNKLLSNTTNKVLVTKSKQILDVFSDDIQTILNTIAAYPYLLSDKQFNELMNVLKQKQQSNQKIDANQQFLELFH